MGAVLVQSTGKLEKVASTTSPETFNASGAFVVGNVVVLALAYSSNVDVTVSIAGTAATKVVGNTFASGGVMTAIFAATIANGSRTDVVITSNTTAHYYTFSFEEWSGITLPVDKTNAATGTSTAPAAGTTGTMSQNNEVLYACFTLNGADQTAITGPSGYTKVWEELTFSTIQGGSAAYKITAVGGAENPTWGLTTSDVWVATVATFPASASSPRTGMRVQNALHPGRSPGKGVASGRFITRPLATTVAGPAILSGADTGAGVNAVVDLSSFTTQGDTGSAAEATAVMAAFSASDTGSAAEASAIVVALSDADSAAAAEASTTQAGIAVADTASGAEAQMLASSSTQADSGTAAEGTAVLAAFSASDTGSAAEGSAVSVTLSATDTAAGAEAQSLAASSTQADSASAAEATATLAMLTGTDAGSAAEGSSVGTGGVNVSDADTGAGTEAAALDAFTTQGDSASAAEAASLFISGLLAPLPPVAVMDGGGPMGGPLGKQQPEPILDLSDENEEADIAHIAAFIIRNLA